MIAEYSDTYTIVFIYDASGSPIGMRYRSASFASEVWETYWYEKNLQGDIVAVYSNDGVKLISYIYDAWGNCETFYETDTYNHNAERNPLKYRGYYYDSDLGLYYLQSRYYDPVTGRFINADGYVSTGQGLIGHNMYAYCNNNPAMFIDPNGKWAIAIGGSLFAVLLGGISYGVAIVVDDNWNIGIQVSEANVFNGNSGGAFGGINAGISVKGGVSTNADTIFDLNDESYSISGSAFNYGIEVSTSNIAEPFGGTNMVSASYGASIAPFSIEAGASKTTTVVSMNIGDFFNSIWEGIKSWFN